MMALNVKLAAAHNKLIANTVTNTNISTNSMVLADIKSSNIRYTHHELANHVIQNITIAISRFNINLIFL